MTINMNLWKVEANGLKEVSRSKLDKEDRLEKWIEQDINILDLDLLLIGRQVATPYGGRIDLLAMDSDGNLVILELKKDKTPRDVVAQALDYASWVKDLNYKEIESIVLNYLDKSLADVFAERFLSALPEELNKEHSIVIVASELDSSSERIVRYLSSEHNLNINCIFFKFFKEGEQEFLGRTWLMDPQEVAVRTQSEKTVPWSGLYFVNVGDGEHRSWEDCRKYGFMSAGQGKRYSSSMKKLKPGDRILAYLKGHGYVGFGEVTSSAVMVKDFEWDEKGSLLLDQPLKQPNIEQNKEDAELADWTVGVKWLKAVPKEAAVTMPGIFANQNVVCRLNHQPTIDFLTPHYSL